MNDFIVHAVMTTSNFGSLELQMNNKGDAVRIREDHGQSEPSVSEWLDIDFDIDCDIWFEYHDDIYYLHQFMKIENVS